MSIKTGLATAFAALFLTSPVVASDADVIGGFRTNDFARFLPDGNQGPEGYVQTEVSTDPASHLATANYEAEDGMSFANVRIFAWPFDNPAAVTDDDGDAIAQSVAGIEDMIADEGFPAAERFETRSGAGRDITCLETTQSDAIGFIYCVAPVKGRVMEVQHFASIAARPAQERRELAEHFVGALIDHIDAAQ